MSTDSRTPRQQQIQSQEPKQPPEWAMEAANRYRKELRDALHEIISDEAVYDLARLIAAACGEQLADLRRYETACKNHLCKYDLIDWLACAGDHGDYCDVCEESDEHFHQTLKRLKAQHAEELAAAERAGYQQRRFEEANNIAWDQLGGEGALARHDARLEVQHAEEPNLAMRALESLTPTGSEFVGDIDRCIAYIRNKVATLQDIAKNTAMRAKAAAAQHAEEITAAEELSFQAGIDFQRGKGHPVPPEGGRLAAHDARLREEWAKEMENAIDSLNDENDGWVRPSEYKRMVDGLRQKES